MFNKHTQQGYSNKDGVLVVDHSCNQRYPIQPLDLFSHLTYLLKSDHALHFIGHPTNDASTKEDMLPTSIAIPLILEGQSPNPEVIPENNPIVHYITILTSHCLLLTK
jgi:hypothetical protein